MNIQKSSLRIWDDGRTNCWARKAIPLLIAHAVARSTITYSQLVSETGSGIAQNAHQVLAHVGKDLRTVSGKIGKHIPPLMAVAVSKPTGIPKRGLYEYFGSDAVPYIGSVKGMADLEPAIQRTRLAPLYCHLAEFDSWHEVLNEFGLEPLPQLPQQTLSEAAATGRTGKESLEHIALKKYVYNNPSVVDITKKIHFQEKEFSFPSADTVDVMFKTESEWVVVEVKADGVSDAELTRGIFQSVKYRALAEASQNLMRLPCKVRAGLVLGGELSPALDREARVLDIQTIQNVQSE